METTSIINSLLSVLFPEEIANHFEIVSIMEKNEEIIIRMDELKELLPKKLSGSKSVVLDGYCNPIELQSFPLKGKPVFLKLYRRRWKYQGEKQHYSNKYDINYEGLKATKEFASFLKETFGQTPDQYNNNLRNIMR